MRWIALLALAACSAPAPEPSEASSWSLRVSTHMGLEPIGPMVSGTMTRNLIDLVYHPLSRYFQEPVAVSGNEARFTLLADATTGAGELAAAFVHPDLVSARAEGRQVIAAFRSAETARALAMDETLLAVGEYKAGESRADGLSIVRKTDGDGPARIDVVNVPSEQEEWRRLIAGEIDIMPSVTPSSLRYLEQVPSLRPVPLEVSMTAGLWFRASEGPTSKLSVRQAIAAAIRRRPLAASLFGTPDRARKGDENLELARALLAAEGYSPEQPLRVTLVVYHGQSELVRAAAVLQQQLATVDVIVEVKALELDQATARVMAKDFDLWLFYGDYGRGFWHILQGNVTGYVSAEFDAAAGAGDGERATRILERDLPLTPLIGLDDFVVVHRRWCNVHPRTLSDYTWLADVRPCAAGEEE